MSSSKITANSDLPLPDSVRRAAGSRCSDFSSLPRRHNLLPSVVGGETVVKDELPYIVGLQYPWGNVSGGTIISESVILTSANCAIPGFETAVAVVAEDHQLYLDDDTEPVRAVKKIIAHEDFHSYEFPNDIAIVVLSEPLVSNEAVQALPFSTEGHNATANDNICRKRPCPGSVDYEWGYRANLTKVLIPIVPGKECKAAYGDEINASNICAGSPEEGKEVCGLDTGGPLVADDLGYKYLAGILSWRSGCTIRDRPIVFTDVSYLANWIAKNLP
ncbi:unnamed protein product [Allacma fusca]|uniref:Peptidase S1 domain-containing protein n=1 Tax=Allacma fusca TaxID=39272 RepID=A0A8J2P1W0_9HEXA|nr:unnamed protein product [Allacma fusca]